jgi:ABC-type Fe3+-hydroxamate transport system substrate-binding protein
VSFPKTANETADMVRSIGAAVERVAEAEIIATRIEATIEGVRERTRTLPAVRFAYLIWREPWMVAGGDTFVSALLSLPQGTNVFADRSERYPAVTVEDIVAAKPDVVLLSSEPFPFKALHADELASLTRLPRERLMLVDGEMLSWHGSRTIAGIEYAERVMAEARDAI